MKEEWEFWERVEIPSPPTPNSLVEDLRILAIELNVLPENKISPHHTYMNSFHTYDQVTNYLEYLIFFLKKLLWGPMKVKFRHLWPRWS